MFATLIAAPMLLAQSATAQMVEQNYETREVAFDELIEGNAQAAITRLEAELEANPGDPAVLINLGTAHLQAGNFDRAQAYYRQARDCEDGYELELADGRWLHSSEAAALALATVEFEALAAR